MPGSRSGSAKGWPVHSGRERVGPCLRALAAQLREGERLIVVDDAGPDGTGAWVREHVPRAEVVLRSGNGGFAACSNDGLRRATAPLVGLVNDDCVVGQGWRDAVLAGMAADPEAGSLACRVLSATDPGALDSAGLEFRPRRGFVQRGQGDPAATAARPGRVLGPAGAAAVYRRSALDAVGLFDESLGSYYEDVDLALRLQLAGLPCRYAPGATALHEGGASFGHYSARHVRLCVRNELVVTVQSLPGPVLRRVLPGLVLHQLRAGASFTLKHGRGPAWAAGVFGFLRRLPSAVRVRRARPPGGAAPELVFVADR